MLKKLHIYIKANIIAIIATLGVATSCIKDDIGTSSSEILDFSCEELTFDTIFTELDSPTQQFVIYNNNKKSIRIKSITLSNEAEGAKFHINVDGFSGEEFHDIEIRGGDSIFVFVEGRINQVGQTEPKKVTDKITFLTNGVTQTLTISAWGQDAIRIKSETITSEKTFTSELPYIILDSLTVEQNATLNIEAGATICFHDKAKLNIDGTIIARGTSQEPIHFRGDRFGELFKGVSYDMMSGQWDGIYFSNTSSNNVLSHVYMRGCTNGIVATGIPENDIFNLTLHNCVLHNSKNSVLSATDFNIYAMGCEFSDAGTDVVKLENGEHQFFNCTFANYYLFSVISGTLVNLNSDNTLFANCIFYGLCNELNDVTYESKNIFFKNCLFKSKGTDDENFITCKWEADPKYKADRNKYIFDYRLADDSDAIDNADIEFIDEYFDVDFYGNYRIRNGKADIGAYVWVKDRETSK